MVFSICHYVHYVTQFHCGNVSQLVFAADWKFVAPATTPLF